MRYFNAKWHVRISERRKLNSRSTETDSGTQSICAISLQQNISVRFPLNSVAKGADLD
jgi:hypothetical protein